MSDGEAEGHCDGMTVVEKDFLTTAYINDNKLIITDTFVILCANCCVFSFDYT